MAQTLKQTEQVELVESSSQSVERAVPTVSQAPTEKPWQYLRANPRLVLFAVLANIGPLMFGFDIVIISSVSTLPAFRSNFGSKTGSSTILPAEWVSLWAGLTQFGTAVGAVFVGWFQDRFGRRATFFAGGLVCGIGAALSYTACIPEGLTDRRVLFLFGKILIGFGTGMLMSSCQTYISEIAPRHLRGVLLGFYAFNVSVGHMMAIAIVFTQASNLSTSAFQIPFATQWAFAGTAMIVCFLLPESPVWLVSKDRIEDAQKSALRLGTGRQNNTVQGIQATVAHEEDEDHASGSDPSYLECFRGVNLRRTRIIIELNLLQQFVGIALISNGAYFLLQAGMSAQYSLMVNLIGIASNMVANAISWWAVPRFGRRSMILYSIVLDFAAWGMMGIAGCFHTSSANWTVGAALLIFGFFNSFGVASAVPVINSEISSVRLRAKSGGIGFFFQAVGGLVFQFFTPYMYNIDQGNWGGKIGFFFLGLSVLAYIVVWYEVPETKGRTFADIDYLFETKTSARFFSKTIVPAHQYESDKTLSKGEAF